MSIPSSSDTNSSSCIGDSFVLPRPCDDLHLHLRDGEVLIDTIRPVIRSGTVDRAIIMPNLQPPVINAKMASEYRERILSTIAQAQQLEKSKHTFTPLMTLYLTDETTPKDITEAKASGIVYACKLYPKGATTHSNQGVSNVLSLMPVFRTMAESGLLLLIHGESTDPQVDIFDRESSFLPVLKQILEGVPTLKIVLEHVTTAAGVEFVKQHSNGQLAATITAHHLLYSRNSLFQGGLQPHLYCLPILKHESDRLALVESIFSPTHRHLFFAGTDSAPHERTNKERSGCAAGCFTAFATVELYLESLASLVICAKYKHDAAYHRQVIEDFLTKNGATFYGLQVNPSRTIQFSRSPMQVPNSMPFGSGSLVPLRFGSTIEWSIQKDDKSDH